MRTDYDKPAVEWISGRPVRKVSPARKHGKLQLRIGALLERLGGAFGEVASDSRIKAFRVDGPTHRALRRDDDTVDVSAEPREAAGQR